MPARKPRPPVAEGNKWCVRCSSEKPLSDFARCAKYPDGKEYICRDCCRDVAVSRYKANAVACKASSRRYHAANRDRAKDNRLKRAFGIGLSEYNRMLAVQGGGCAICGGPDRRHSLSVDHCHSTGRVRGLLCGHCNTGIGLLKDSPTMLLAAALYLQGRRAAEVA